MNEQTAIPQSSAIQVKNARVNNLKGVDVTIPRGRFVVVTGVSGSGKSSLAFDTLYAEGQRRYVESLSSYARQFMGKMHKPEVDFIRGLPPAIAIEQKVTTRNPRSTVGTATEIYDYMRLLFSRIGHTISPVSGTEVRRHNVEDVIRKALEYPDGTRIAIAAPVVIPEGRSFATQLEVYRSNGYTRLMKAPPIPPLKGGATEPTEASSNTYHLVSPSFRGGTGGAGDFININQLLSGTTDAIEAMRPEDCLLLIDRLAVTHEGDELSRLAESAEAAFFEGHDTLTLAVWAAKERGGALAPRIPTVNGNVTDISATAGREDAAPLPSIFEFSRRFESDGMTFTEPTEQSFNFNNPIGACPRCEGFGKVLGIDERLVVPNQSLSVYDDAVVCWRGEKMSQWKRDLIRVAARNNFPIHRPYRELTQAQKDFLWHGNASFEGIDGFFRMVESNQYKIQYRVMLAHYRGKTLCPVCHGSRLRPEAEYVKVGGSSITELVQMPVSRLQKFFDTLPLTADEEVIAARLLKELRQRIGFLLDVGLGYLTLDRLANTLSGGESQRINLATSLGSSLVGSLYILDEPSIGLHPRDTARLIGVLKRLRDLGNTVVVVEHDEEIMRAADYIIDVGPDAGRLGGQIVYQGPLKEIDKANNSYTADYLTGKRSVDIPKRRRRSNSYIEVVGATEHNLKDITVRFPLGVMTVVTGVSGSGKSTLVRDILYRALIRRLGEPCDAPGEHGSIGGDVDAVKAVEFVDQNPIGRSTRSNPATYLKAYDEIRRLFADLQGARQMGFTPAYFSFNADGGRCPECKGEGSITIEMQFMADITIPCESCHGRRFKPDVLAIKYRDKSIDEVLDMTVNQAIEFFGEADGGTERRIVSRLQPLQDVGLGYIKLGQSSATLSGGENQRVKLAYFLAQEAKGCATMFIFDEPTTGLHTHDVARLLDSFNRLIARGHTIVIIEHNMHVISAADHVIDLGPEGGDAGGSLVAEGTPEQIAACSASHTGAALRPLLGN